MGTNVAAVKATAYAPLTQSGEVAQRVIDTLGLTESSGEISASIGYQVEPSSPRIQVTATSTSPQKAKDIANAVVGGDGQGRLEHRDRR